MAECQEALSRDLYEGRSGPHLETRGISAVMRFDLRSLRDELGLLREQVRIQATTLARLDDTITMNVLDRLQVLEEK
jgi:hypothetical protein